MPIASWARTSIDFATLADKLRVMTFLARTFSYSAVGWMALASSILVAQETTRLDRTNLLSFHRDGKIVQGKSLADWKKRRAEIVAGMCEVMGPLPGKEKRCALDIKIDEEVDCGSYVRRLISYQAEPNGRVPAYLLIPKDALDKKKRCRGVLCLHPTDMADGNGTVVGLTKKENRGYAKELAERGFVTIAPAYPIMAGYNPDLKALGYESGTMKAIWNNIRALDLLESLPFVKRAGFGVIGHSLGGHNSIYTTIFDERIKVVVSSCGFDSYLDYMDGNITGWTQERYMPKLKHYAGAVDKIPFDFYEMIPALAPDALFVNAPTGDANFKYQSVDRILNSARPVYSLYGRESKIHVEHPDCPHDFPEKIREASYAFIDENLR
jgi:dienelactone hydrolase